MLCTVVLCQFKKLKPKTQNQTSKCIQKMAKANLKSGAIFTNLKKEITSMANKKKEKEKSHQRKKIKWRAPPVASPSQQKPQIQKAGFDKITRLATSKIITQQPTNFFGCQKKRLKINWKSKIFYKIQNKNFCKILKINKMYIWLRLINKQKITNIN